MANKSLSQVLGAGGREIGDVIKTKATALTDGKVLLPLDGSTITPASYPLLEALLPDTVGMEPVDYYISSDDSSLNDTSDVFLAHKLFVNDAGTVVLAGDDAANYWFQDADGAASLVTYGVVSDDGSSAVGSSDGVELGYALIGGGASSSDLEWWYSTDSGATAFTEVTLEAADVMDGTVVAFMNRAGTAAKVLGRNTTDLTLDTYGSGADITTGWSLDFAHTYSATPPSTVRGSACSDDFATMVIVDQTNGLWISRNAGSSWSENVLMPNLDAPNFVAVTDTDVIFAVDTYPYGGRKVFKSTSGVTFTEALTVNEAKAALNLSFDVEQILFTGVFSDGTDVFVVGSAINGAPGAVNTNIVHQDRLVIFYSDDEGVTWSGDVVEHGLPKILGAGTNAIRVSEAANGFAMSPGCRVLVWNSQQASTGDVFFADVTAPGKVLPIMPGYKIVADAP